MKKQIQKQSVKYKARKGAPYTNEDAEIIGNVLDKLKNGQGFITPTSILEYAKQEDSELHQYFEWDNSSAAEAYRLQQARELVNHIVQIVVIDGKKTEERSFVSVNIENRGRVYVSLKAAIENKNYRQQLLSKAITTLENLTWTMKMFRDADLSA